MERAILYLFFVAVGLLVYRPWMLDALIEAINNFGGRGGGPRTPMHPSPVNYSALLRRRACKVSS